MDPELEAMQALNTALSKLEPAVAQRVLRWAAERFNLSLSTPPSVPSRSSTPLEQFGDFADLYDRVNPQTEPERALVAGYWIQSQEGSDWDSQAANTALRNLGHPVSNITRALDQLMSGTPRFVMQVSKSGSSKQARKRYRLTIEGTRRVQEMLQLTSA